MKVLVTGSREWVDRRRIIEWFLAFDEAGSHVLIEGGARGADDIASHIALALGWKVVTVRAEWERGKQAGVERNLKMLDMNPDLVVGFHLDNSPGTAHCLREAEKRGLKVVRVCG